MVTPAEEMGPQLRNADKIGPSVQPVGKVRPPARQRPKLEGGHSMNAQTKDELVSEIIGDLEAEQGFALSPAKRRQLDDALREYLETMEQYIDTQRKERS